MNPWPHFTSCSFRASKTDGTRNCITFSAELSHCVAVLRLRSCETGLVHQAVTPWSHGVLLPVVFVSSSVPPVLRDGPCTKQRIPGMYIKIHQTDLTSQEEKGFSCYCNKAHRLTRIQIQNLTLGITEAVASYSNQILIILSRHQHISVQSEITKLYQVKSQSHPSKTPTFWWMYTPGAHHCLYLHRPKVAQRTANSGDAICGRLGLANLQLLIVRP